MKDTSVDRRVRRTKKLLRQALTKLLLEKDINQITVIELTKLADVNRGTFYLHYSDIYDLYKQLENDMIDEFKIIFQRHYQQKSEDTLLSIVSETYDFMMQNADMCAVILKRADSCFLTRLIELGKPRVRDEWKTLLGDVDPYHFGYYYSFIANGCVGLIHNWFSGGMKESPEEMARLTEQIIRNIVVTTK